MYMPWYARLLRCRHCYDLTYEQRQIHRSWVELFCKHTTAIERLKKILKGVGQKGFSRLEAEQYAKVEAKLLQLAKSMEELDL